MKNLPTDTDIRKLAEVVASIPESDELYLPVRLAAEYGLRPNEIATLNLREDVSAGGVLHVRSRKENRDVLICLTADMTETLMRHFGDKLPSADRILSLWREFARKCDLRFPFHILRCILKINEIQPKGDSPCHPSPKP